MLDIKFIRENIDLVKDGARKKRVKVDIDRLLELDNQKKELQQEFEKKRAEQNRVSKEIPQLSDDTREEKIQILSQLKQEIKDIEEKIRPIQKE